MEQILEPAITLAEEGFPVAEVTAHFWDKGKFKYGNANHRRGFRLSLTPHIVGFDLQ